MNEKHLKALTDHVWAVLQHVKRTSGWNPAAPVEVETRFEFAGRKGKTTITIRQLPFGDWRTKVPDVDNLTKLVLEALKPAGVVDDDSQVVRIVSEKVDGAR